MRRSSRARALHELRREIDGSEDVTYHIVRPKPSAATRTQTSTPATMRAIPRRATTTPNDDAWAEKPSSSTAREAQDCAHAGTKSGSSRASRACSLVCALLGGLGGGAIEGSSPAPAGPAAASSNSGGTLVTQPVSLRPELRRCDLQSGVQAGRRHHDEVTYTNYFGQTSSQASCGSGFFITDDGYVLTNYHVISTAHQYGYAVSRAHLRRHDLSGDHRRRGRGQ